MKTLFFVAAAIALFSAKTGKETERHFVGSTPGEDVVRKLVSIPVEASVDFIRWDLHLSDEGRFIMKINFGVSKPNTLGFENNGQTKSYEGTYSEVIHDGKSFVKLFSPGLPLTLELMEMGENILHIVNQNQQLLVGNGGWSYLLNNAQPAAESQMAITSSIKSGVRPVSVFVGRTPCQQLAVNYELASTAECFKLKFKITLVRDPNTLKPLRFTLRGIVDNKPRDITGSWSVVKGIAGNPGATIYKLTSELTKKEMSLLVVNDDIVYFLQTDDKLFVGDENFSYALNRSRN